MLCTSASVSVFMSYAVCSRGLSVFRCVLFFCGMLQCVYVCTFVILSPTDYQSILAELQSPAVLHSSPYFLEPELPVTPNPSLAQHQQHHCPEPDTPFSVAQPQPPPWSPEIDPSSRDPDSPPKSPPRPCELALTVPAFVLPDPVPPKVQKPHIALNDQLLLSEEEDKSFPEMEHTHKLRSHSFPSMCELEVDMAYSTSSPSLSSVSSVTPSSPDRTQVEDGGVQMGALNGQREDVGLKGDDKEEVEKVVDMAAAELAEGNRFVEKWVEQDLIKDVERKCEIVTKDRFKTEEENIILVEEEKGSAEQKKGAINELHDPGQVEEKRTTHEVEEVRDVDGSKDNCGLTEIGPEVEKGVVNLGEELQQGRTDDSNGELQLNNERNSSVSSEGDQAAEDQSVADLSPQPWVDALGQLQPSESGSNEEEEEGSKETADEALGSLFEEEKNEEGGSEENEEDKETAEPRDQDGLKQEEKNMCSFSGWHSDSSSVNVEPPTPGRSVSSDLLDRRER